MHHHIPHGSKSKHHPVKLYKGNQVSSSTKHFSSPIVCQYRELEISRLMSKCMAFKKEFKKALSTKNVKNLAICVSGPIFPYSSKTFADIPFPNALYPIYLDPMLLSYLVFVAHHPFHANIVFQIVPRHPSYMYSFFPPPNIGRTKEITSVS